MQGFLSENVKFNKVSDYTAAATDSVDSSGVDMGQEGGWDGVLFITSYVTPAANNLIKVQGCATDTSSSYADLAGTEVDLSGASDEDQWVDVYRPQYRYVRCRAVRATSSALGDIWALLYRGKSLPADNLTSGTIYGKAVDSPTAGTA